MKKNYEKTLLINLVIFSFIVVEIVIVIMGFFKEYRSYKVISTIMITDNYIKTYLDDYDFNLIKKINYFYIDNRKTKYRLVDVSKNVINKNNKFYHEIIFGVKLSKKYKDNDVVMISIYDKKYKIYNIFKKCLEDDK